MQLVLNIKLRHDATFDNFLASEENTQLLSALKKLSGHAVIRSERACGLSHLLQAACHETAQAIYLPLKEIMPMGPEVFEGLESLNLVCIDDVDLLQGQAEWEEALFHLFNRLTAAQKCLVLGSHVALKMQLKDLDSRLHACMQYYLHELDDEHKQLLLHAEAKRRGFVLPAEVVNYLLRYYPRDMSTQLALLEKLDLASLEKKHRVTLPFVKSVLEV